MLSLVGTHVILFHHRRLLYPSERSTERSEEQQATPREGLAAVEKKCLAVAAKTSKPLLILLVVIGQALLIAGSIVNIYQVTNTDNRGVTLKKDYSLISVGLEVPESTLDENDVGIRWIQAMYFALALALPIWNAVLWVSLYVCPMTVQRQRSLFFLSEITFSWSSIEVFVVSAVFAVLQLPTFGNGLIDAGCDQCYVVGSSIKPEFAILAIGCVWNVIVCIVLYRRAHCALYEWT